MFYIDPVSGEVISYELRTYVAPKPGAKSIQTEKGTFTLLEKPLSAKIELGKPDVIYSEEFYSLISNLICQGKSVEINCGPKKFKTDFIADELASLDLLEKLQNQDGQKIKAEKSEYRIRQSWFSLLGTKYVFVTYKRIKEKSDDLAPYETGYTINCQHNTPLFTPPTIDDAEKRDKEIELFLEGSKYSRAPVLEIDEPVINYLDKIEKLINRAGIVQIKRIDLFGEVEELGMFVEKDLDTGEIIINLNGQDEVRFDEIFSPLIMQYLADNKTVLIECDICSLAEDIPAITNKISEGDIYDKIYEPISRLTGAEVYVQRRETNPFTGEEKNYIVLEPSSV